MRKTTLGIAAMFTCLLLARALFGEDIVSIWSLGAQSYVSSTGQTLRAGAESIGVQPKLTTER